MKEIIITQEATELFKILKFTSMVDSGGQAKQVIEEGQVAVNGKPESRKRRKMYTGDIIQYKKEKLKLISSSVELPK